jgi:hypothetical protein
VASSADVPDASPTFAEVVTSDAPNEARQDCRRKRFAAMSDLPKENLINVSSIAHNGGVRSEHVVVITAPT